MTDKEDKTSLPLDSEKNLLILAAKAMGYTDCEYVTELNCIVHDEGVFNSFTSNDDCFRLETALGLVPDWYALGVGFDTKNGSIFEPYAAHNFDKDKARRYASTRAAALRGRE